ncbi:hypothetical protein PHYBLDRAFT_169072 [Phycomyces blakesleeanus NRRL 1555(-)]|uniref:Uncharacterized protein n=1 Tax=Phycomyces blakesleeanus (strain ATCC 8743b / DSM 1359 / FGSC 10004 / NBRC 33097 / NRRL 1555) TaxID=763407 RepID=A0A162U6S9_PHYB8|nr:hypothetical protein PHYBLDRAFT_169072 [Phycomyces blakesleeanus NRRL 1555(-)]OAD72813.1 hypothetical protein PHYBLDRAFT_169072 [Phycomyces blakesleeanus NRRL 1555(-)]|eukprot:XP_018290853.1 hypothetical protein PHYBLDRAFT_169072 [Phycomyces blakesleeanus NRRL 1555(-)]
MVTRIFSGLGVRLCSNLMVTMFPGGARYFYLTGLINPDYMSGARRLSLILQGKIVCPQRNTIYPFHISTTLIASHAENHKVVLSLECDAIFLNIFLFTGLLTRIMPFPFFHLLIFPEFDCTNWDQIELFDAGKKRPRFVVRLNQDVTTTKKCRPPKISE